jgi:hypothetical protein
MQSFLTYNSQITTEELLKKIISLSPCELFITIKGFLNKPSMKIGSA